MEKETMNAVTTTYWCDNCNSVFELDMLSDKDNCPKCFSSEKHIHQVLKDKKGVKDIVVITEDNYKYTLPSKLIYFYNQLLGHTMTFSELKICSYSLSRNALSVDEKKWYK